MTKEDIAKVLKQLRTSSGLTQKEAAERLGKKQQTIASWESGQSQPDANTLFIICSLYGTSVDEAFGFKKDGTTIGKKDIDLIEKYHSLDPFGQETVDIILEREISRVGQISDRDSQIADLKSRPVTLVDFYTLKPDSTRITEYFRSASAGDGIFILGNEVKARAIIPESSWIENTDYVIGVSGDSMKPDFEDGDNVMVSQHVPLHHGDVGIFVVNGNVYIKEYGETELISRNPDFPNIKISEYDNIVCMGKVLGKLKGDYKIVNE